MSAPLEPVKPELGKRYRTRNGIVTPPLTKSNGGTNYSFEAWVQEPEYPEGDLSCRSWLATGESLVPGFYHKLDLVEEIQTPEPDVKSKTAR